MQVLVVAPESMLGTSAIVKITSVGRWSVFGEVIETIQDVNYKTTSSTGSSSENKCSPCYDPCNACASSRVQETCACGPEGCGGTTLEESAVSTNAIPQEDRSSRNLIGWLLRKRKNNVVQKLECEVSSGFKKKQECVGESKGSWNVVDRVLLGGILVSFLTILTLLIHHGFRTLSN